MSNIYDLTIGNSPLILSQPHSGLMLADGMKDQLTDAALKLPDTDWHIPSVYADCAKELDATVLTACYSRYVIDLNRDPSGASLYPGQSVTELCPTGLFDNAPLYKDGLAPTEAQIGARKDQFWHPYHQQLQKQIKRIKDKYGFALLYDCHSIRSVVPRFFDGTLPDLNVGTANDNSADPALLQKLVPILENSPYSHVTNGRFKGGYITRHYGDPANHIHALQMEIGQKTYMDEIYPYFYRQDRAATLKPMLQNILATMIDWGLQTYAGRIQ